MLAKLSLRRIFSARTSAKDPFVFLLYISVDPVIVLADIAGSNRNLQEQLAFTFAQTFGFIVGWIWFFFAKWLLNRIGQGKHPFWWLTILFGIALAVVTDQAVGTIRFGPDHLIRLHESLLLTGAIGALLAVGVALFTGARDKYDQMREGIVAERARKAQQISTALPEVQNFIQQAKTNLRAERVEDPVELAKRIRELVDLRLRPISYALWQQEDRRLKRFSLGLLSKEVLSHPIRTAYIPAGFSLLVAARYFLNEFDVFEAWLRLSLIFGFIWLVPEVHWMLHRKLNAVRRLGALNFPISVAIATFAAYAIPVGLMGAPERLRPLSYLLTSFLVIGLPAIVSSVSGVTKELLDIQKERLKDELGGELTQETGYLLAATKARDTANYLHGTTQNKLLAAALLLEKTKDSKVIESQLAAVEQILDDALVLGQRAGLEQELELLKKNWAGMLEISFQKLSTLELPPSQEQLIALCIREAISNSFRHGHASSVSIAIDNLNGSHTLTIKDDGLGPRKPKAGMGSKLFDSAGTWSMEAMPLGGTKVKIVFGF